MKIVHIQSVLPEEDVIALKQKSRETSIKEAIARAVYHYLKCDPPMAVTVEKKA
ncbi:MAG: DUF5371 family protein [Candidatus Methanoperedens sp.]|nr:DUF5371 family protein [Candidatus Methanoperedens sp.]MCZ7360089.1 DUF5371 family protein [Candidatus Methanoperedens sp.]